MDLPGKESGCQKELNEGIQPVSKYGHLTVTEGICSGYNC